MIKNILMFICVVVLVGCSCDHPSEADRFLKEMIETVQKEPALSNQFVRNSEIGKTLEKEAALFSINYNIVGSDYLEGIYEYVVNFDSTTIHFQIAQQCQHDQSQRHILYLVSLREVRREKGSPNKF